MMLPLPRRGVARSVRKHNCRPEVMCDWIEGSVLLGGEELSRTDLLDVLMEQAIYDDEDFCFEALSSWLGEIRTRLSWLGAASPIHSRGQRLEPVGTWKDASAHSFCLMMHLKHLYGGWTGEFGKDYTEQGELFELIAEAAMSEILQGWLVVRTGWTREQARKIGEVVPSLADQLAEATGDLRKWTSAKANEAGVDLVWTRPFPDRRGGYPVYLVQCASGEDWLEKVESPNLGLWTKLIDFRSPPAKAMVTAFALAEPEFTWNCPRVTGLLLDRYRLLAGGRREDEWLSKEVRDRIVAWLEPRVDWLMSRQAE